MLGSRAAAMVSGIQHVIWTTLMYNSPIKGNPFLLLAKQECDIITQQASNIHTHIDMSRDQKNSSCITTQKAKVTNPCSTRTSNLGLSSRRSAAAFMWCADRSLQQRKGYISIKYSIQLVCVMGVVGGTSLPTLIPSCYSFSYSSVLSHSYILLLSVS